MVDPPPIPSTDHHYHFITGKLAASAVRQVVAPLADQYGFAYSVDVMPITVAALMTPKWLSRHLRVPDSATHVILPGYVSLENHASGEGLAQPVYLTGPKDCRELPAWFGGKREPPDLSEYDIEIIAEINKVPRLSITEFITEAEQLIRDGANRIDVGCDPSQACAKIGDYVSAARDHGILVSIDSFDDQEVAAATRAGASLVLSVNSTNRHLASEWESEVVAIPDTPEDLDSLRETIAYLNREGVPHRIDPILEPIGANFFASLQRYAIIRREYPDAPMMMGIGNVTELSDVDSAGINFMLLAICQELTIQSVLTTQVINWARTSVRECDIARRLVKYSMDHQVPPKRLTDELLLLRDSRIHETPIESLDELAEAIRDNNYRLFAESGALHLVSGQLHLKDTDPFRLFEQLLQRPQAENVDASHAFYLGYEMAKASLALQLGKQYDQDRSLRWGFLTVEEDLHRLQRTSRHRNPKNKD